MNHLKRRVAAIVGPMAIVAMLGAPAQANVIDFVGEATAWSDARTGTNNSQATRTIDGIGVTLLAERIEADGDVTNRRLTFFERGTPDGLGIGDDEITRQPVGSGFSSEFLTISFSQRVLITGFDFRDLYVQTRGRSFDPQNPEKETARIDFHDGEAARMFEAVETRGGGNLGLRTVNFAGIETDRLTFSVFSSLDTELGPTDDSQPDYALGAVRFEEIAPVPLPATVWMLIAAVAGLWGIRKRAAQA